MDEDRDEHTRNALKPHAYSMILPTPDAGLDEVDDHVAANYLDRLIELLFDTLADADPWRETWGLFDHDVEGRAFGTPESFSDLPMMPLRRRAIVNFGPVARDPQTIEGKKRLVAWLRLRHKIIVDCASLPDMTVALADQAALLAAGGTPLHDHRRFLAIYQIDDSAFFFARDVSEPPELRVIDP